MELEEGRRSLKKPGKVRENEQMFWSNVNLVKTGNRIACSVKDEKGNLLTERTNV